MLDYFASVQAGRENKRRNVQRTWKDMARGRYDHCRFHVHSASAEGAARCNLLIYEPTLDNHTML